jgi:hypothetical protein
MALVVLRARDKARKEGEGQMIRSVASKVMWVGKATVFLLGLALMLALVFGMASTALGANGGNFILGSLNNTATAITKLTGTVGGGPALRVSNPSTATGSTALDLQVATGKAPMKVNSSTKVANLNADRLDNRDASQIGVNGYELVRVQSTFDSTAHKVVHARCPEGKLAIGGGAQVFPSLSDSRRDSAPIVLRYSTPNTFDDRDWTVIADEFQDYGFSWWVSATAICATGGIP